MSSGYSLLSGLLDYVEPFITGVGIHASVVGANTDLQVTNVTLGANSRMSSINLATDYTPSVVVHGGPLTYNTSALFLSTTISPTYTSSTIVLKYFFQAQVQANSSSQTGIYIAAFLSNVAGSAAIPLSSNGFFTLATTGTGTGNNTPVGGGSIRSPALLLSNTTGAPIPIYFCAYYFGNAGGSGSKIWSNSGSSSSIFAGKAGSSVLVQEIQT